MQIANDREKKSSPKNWLLAWGLMAATFALFFPAIGYDFLNYDDNLYVYENQHVLQGLSWDGLVYAFRTIDGASWMPATWLSYQFNVALLGSRPAGFHLVNLILHCTSVGLLFSLMRRLTKEIWVACAIAAVFAVHPQRAESVVWIAERKDVLSVCFWMLALLAYVRHAEQPSPQRFAWVVLFFILGVMAKPMVISLPLILLLLDFWPLQRFGGTAATLREKFWPLLREKIPLLLVCVATAVATVWSQGKTHGILAQNYAWHEKLFRVVENVGFYLKMFFAPTNLSILYRPAPLDYFWLVPWGLVLAAGSALILWRARRWPWLCVGWFWFLFTLAPVAGFIPIGYTNVADRYSYLPAVGLALALIISAAEFLKRWPRARTGLATLLTAWILFCALTTWADLPRWRNTFAIFESAYRQGGHFIACDQLGSLLYSRQEYQASLAVCNRGLKDNPQFASLYNTRGGNYFALGDWDRALADFNRSIALNPAFLPAYYGRAMVHLRRKEYALAQIDADDYARYGGPLDISALKIPKE